MSDSPFFYLGPITPQEKLPWEVMKWHQDAIIDVLSHLDCEPPEYVAVLAPAKGGKTTFAHQLMDYASLMRRYLLFVYVDLAGLEPRSGALQILSVPHEDSGSMGGESGRSPIEIKILRRIWTAFKDRIADVLTHDRFEPAYRARVAEAINLAEPTAADDLEDFLRQILPALHKFTRVVLVCDGIRDLAPKTRQALFNRLRAIHAIRFTQPLRAFSTVLLAESMRTSDGFVSPLINAVMKLHLPTSSCEDFAQFLARCGAKLNCVAFDTDAVAYLWEQTGGHAALAQQICDAIMRCNPDPTRVGMAEILEGIAQCFEKGGGVFDRLLVDSAFDEETKTLLAEILRKVVVLYHTIDPRIAHLADVGIIREGPQHRCEISSPILRALFLKRFRPVQERLPRLTEMESILVEMPHFLSLLIDQPLFDKLWDVLDNGLEGSSSGASTGMPHCEPWDLAELRRKILVFLQTEEVTVDEIAIQFLMQRYLTDTPPGTPSRESILGLMAKIYAAWYRETVR